MKATTTLIRPILTEKSSLKQGQKLYTFLVDLGATKVDVKQAVKELYGLEVKDVRVSVTPSKTRLIGRGRPWIKRPKFKKAILTLKDKKATLDVNKFKGDKK